MWFNLDLSHIILYHIVMKRIGTFSFILVMLACAGVFSFSYDARAAAALSDGLVVKGSGSEVYIMENGMRRWIVDAMAFDDLALPWNRIVTVSDEDLDIYPKGRSILAKSRYPDGMLLRGDGVKVYLVDRGSRRWITNENEFNALRLDWRAVMDVPPAKLKTISEGKQIIDTQTIIRPLTVLLDTPDPVIEDTTAIFHFNGISARAGTQALRFDTFLEGVDTAWVSSSGERTVRVPAKSGSYRFFVRAKDPDGVADATPESFSFTVTLSPYYDMVSISANGRSADPLVEQVTVQGRAIPAQLDITGWTIGSKEFRTRYAIPTAIDIPNHPFLQQTKNIVIDSKSKVTVYSGKSASGLNFQLNECIGYLKAYYTFTPALPTTCPSIPAYAIDTFDAYCKKTISSATSACKEPNTNDILLDADCRDYISQHIGYSKCVEDNYRYQGFFKNEWRVYLGHTSDLWRDGGDTIELRDKEGLLVSKYKY